MKKKLSVFLSAIIALTIFIMPISAKAGYYYFLWPVPSCSAVSAGFDDGRRHNAIDIAAGKGSQVIASGAGIVTYTYTGCSHNYGKSYNCCNSIGNCIKIQHYDTIGGQTVVTRYGHLTDIYVKEGDHVNAGQVIGTVGSTGYSTGNHLDFKMYMGDNVIDPGPYLQIPADLYYCGSDWANNGSYIQQLKSYNNNSYGGSGNIAYINPNSSGSLVVTPLGLRLAAGYTYPVLLIRGSRLTVSGTVTSGSNISSVTASILSPDGSAKYTRTANVNAQSYDLAGLASALRFERLSAGDYAYEVKATDSSGTHTLLYQPFVVSAGATMAACSDCTAPLCLKPGESFTIRGTVASTNNMTSVRAAIVSNADSKTYYEKTLTPNSNICSLKEADLALKFNKLPEGEYRYQVTATDVAGQSLTVLDKLFYVSTKTLVSGTLSISGLGYSGTVDSDLAAPYAEKTLSADLDISPAAASIEYKWYADGKLLEGESSKTLYLSRTLLGKKISVEAVPTGSYFGKLKSSETKPVTTMQGSIGDLVGKEVSYTIDLVKLIVSPALPGTTASQIMQGLLSDALFTGIYDKDGKKMLSLSPVYTGCSLRSMLFDTIVVMRYDIVVLGDVRGEGRLSPAGARLALRCASGLEGLSNAAYSAADIDQNGKVTPSDARFILRCASGLEKLK